VDKSDGCLCPVDEEIKGAESCSPFQEKQKHNMKHYTSNQLKKKDHISNAIHKEAIMYVHKASYAKLCKKAETMYALLCNGLQHKLGR
jgi:hypothetical protein